MDLSVWQDPVSRERISLAFGQARDVIGRDHNTGHDLWFDSCFALTKDEKGLARLDLSIHILLKIQQEPKYFGTNVRLRLSVRARAAPSTEQNKNMNSHVVKSDQSRPISTERKGPLCLHLISLEQDAHFQEKLSAVPWLIFSLFSSIVFFCWQSRKKWPPLSQNKTIPQ